MQKDRDTADTYRKMAYEGDPRAMNNLECAICVV